MDINVIEAADGVTHVMLDGRFDIAGAQAADPRFSALAGSSKALIVDLTKVSFIASLGVRTLMVSAKTLIRRGADMAVCGANKTSRRCCARRASTRLSLSTPTRPRPPPG